MEDYREMWCDGKWLPQVEICRLSLVRVLGYCWDRPTVLYGKTFGLPIKGYILYCKRVGWLVGWLVGQLVESFSRSSVLQTFRLL